MALKASCTFCKKSVSAPEEYRGKKMDCPACGRRFLVQTEEDLQVAEALAEEARQKQVSDLDRIALIERVSSRAEKRPGTPYFEEFQTGAEGVRHFNPRARSRFLRFRTLSDFLLLGAYVELLLSGVGMGLTIYLKVAGAIESVAVLLVILVIWLTAGLGLYLIFKYLGELAFLLADAGDQQNDLVQLLRDIRENTDRPEPQEREGS